MKKQLEQICETENPPTKEMPKPYQTDKPKEKPYETEPKDHSEFYDLVNSLQELG